MTTLGSLLVQNRIVGVIEIEKALQRQVIVGGDLATNLLELNLVEEGVLTKYAAKSFGLPVLEKALLDVPDENAVKMLPWAAADEHKVVPVRLEGDRLILAVSSPLPENALSEVGFVLGVEFVPRFVLEFRLAVLLNRCFGLPMTKRFINLKNRLAPEVVLDLPPLVPQPTQNTGLLSAAEAPKKKSMQPTVPADPDYMATVQKAADAARLSGEVIRPVEVSEAPYPTDAKTRVPGEPVPQGESVQAGAPMSKAPKPRTRTSMAPPINLDAVRDTLLQAAHRDEILDIFMGAAHGVFEYALLFVIQGTDASAYSTVGDDGRVHKTSVPVVPLDMGGMFQTAHTTGSFYLGPPGNTPEDELILQEMGRSRPKNCAILPVSLRGRIILMLYGDCGTSAVKAQRMAELTQLTRLTAEAFERLLLEKKYGKYRAAASMAPSKPGHMAFSQVPGGEADLSSSAGLYRIVHSDRSGKVRQNGESESSESEGPAENVRSSQVELSENAGDASRENSVPMAEVVFCQPASPKPPAQLVVDDEAQRQAKSSKIVAFTEETPRSVVVNMNEEIDRLVTRILESTKRFDQAALDVLLGMGEDAVKKLVEHFPGPLVVDRYVETEKLPRVDRHGPLLKALIGFGKTVIPHVLPLLESLDTDVRFYATFLFSEMRFPEALDGLTSRLFDGDRHVRAIAVDVIRGFSGYPEFRWSVGQIIEALESPTRDLEGKRIAAATLGDLGAPGGVEALIGMLESVDDKLVRASRRALTKITFFDHGYSKRRWSDWYNLYRNKTRIEWAVEGLSNEDDAVRRCAWLFLAPKVEDVAETGPDGPSSYREYKEVQDRLRRWWRDEGRDLHRITTGN